MNKIFYTIQNAFKSGTNTYQPAQSADESSPEQAVKRFAVSKLSPFWRRVIFGIVLLIGLFLLYRLAWLTGWYLPYRLICNYLQEHLPMLASWQVETMALLLTTLVLAQAGAIVGFVLFGKHKRLMLYLSLTLALLHGAIGWYGYGRFAVDESGQVRVRLVESSDGRLKVIERDYDPETGKRARWATENDLVMLDLQRRQVAVKRVGAAGPFRSAQGTIIVYTTRRNDGRIVLYNGPRSPEVNGDMQPATNEIISEFLGQQKGAKRKP